MRLFIPVCFTFLLMGCAEAYPSMPKEGCQFPMVSGLPAPIDPATGKPMQPRTSNHK
jgi:hypothetical protein